MTTARLTPPLKWHGGKHYLAKRIVALMPPHLHYVEPYAGGLSVLLAKDPQGVSEVVNDTDGDLTNFWKVLQNDEWFEAFMRRIAVTPFSACEYSDSDRRRCATKGPFSAATFFIRCRQSLAGRGDTFAPLSKTRTRRGMNEQASAWLSAIEGLPAVHERLKSVAILNDDALSVIRLLDSPKTLFYCDPPYLQETRAAKKVFRHEMTEEQHGELIETLSEINGKFLLSGYRTKLYDVWAHACGWDRVDFDLPNNAAGGTTKRRMTESVWANYELAAAAQQDAKQ